MIPNVLPGTRFTKIAAGGEHNPALKSDGTVVAWGENNHSQSTVPEGLLGIVDIAAGGPHNLALKSNGTVVAWGFNLYGESTVPSGLNRITAIATGTLHSLALIAGAPHPFSLSAPQWMPEGLFRYTITGEPGRNYGVQCSSNLTLWTDLRTITLGGTSVQITETNAQASPQRFYSARTQ